MNRGRRRRARRRAGSTGHPPRHGGCPACRPSWTGRRDPAGCTAACRCADGRRFRVPAADRPRTARHAACSARSVPPRHPTTQPAPCRARTRPQARIIPDPWRGSGSTASDLRRLTTLGRSRARLSTRRASADAAPLDRERSPVPTLGVVRSGAGGGHDRADLAIGSGRCAHDRPGATLPPRVPRIVSPARPSTDSRSTWRAVACRRGGCATAAAPETGCGTSWRSVEPAGRPLGSRGRPIGGPGPAITSDDAPGSLSEPTASGARALRGRVGSWRRPASDVERHGHRQMIGDVGVDHFGRADQGREPG